VLNGSDENDEWCAIKPLQEFTDVEITSKVWINIIP